MGLRTIELFAGVGGFRQALQKSGIDVAWSNQWEPASKAQHASACYMRHFGDAGHVNADIATVPASGIPAHDLLVGGFPCQDYSVATTLDKAGGLTGRKGVLWWQIHRIVEHHRPAYLLLENVDRLLRSPAHRRGRDFGVMLACLARLGYVVEWRVLNAAEHGAPTRRRRTFILAARAGTAIATHLADVAPRGVAQGFFAGPFPIHEADGRPQPPHARVGDDPAQATRAFAFAFPNAGIMAGGNVWGREVSAVAEPPVALGTILDGDVHRGYDVPPARLADWRYTKGAKSETRTAANGHVYDYKEGPVPFPDPVDRPARTILTGEGPGAPNRSTHVVVHPGTRRRLRFLTPVECERLMGFPDGWTDGMPPRWRYFTMGNAVVVPLVERMGRRLQEWLAAPPAPAAQPDLAQAAAATALRTGA